MDLIYLKDNNSNPKYKIYHNPTRNVLNIEYNNTESYKFTIYILVNNKSLLTELKMSNEIILLNNKNHIFTNMNLSILEELCLFYINIKIDIPNQKKYIIIFNPSRFEYGDNPLISQVLEEDNIEKIFATGFLKYIFKHIYEIKEILNNKNSINMYLEDIPYPSPPLQLRHQTSCINNNVCNKKSDTLFNLR